MNKLALKMKLVVGFGAVLTFLFILGSTTYISVAKMERHMKVVEDNVEKKELTVQLGHGIDRQLAAIRGYLLTGQERYFSGWQEGGTIFTESVQKLGPMLVTETGKRALAKISDLHKQLSEQHELAFQTYRSGQPKKAIDQLLSERNNELRSAIQAEIAELVKLEEKLKKDAMNNQDTAQASLETMTVVLGLAGCAMGVTVAFLIARSITGSTTRMLGMIEQIAANNLAIEDMQITSEDEIGRASLALNKMKNNLREVVQSIAGTAEHVASASEEISSSATQQSQGAETQKDQTAQVATAMQEMSSTVLQVSENSSRASEASRKAAETARQGGAIVEDTLAKMRAIAESVSNTAKKVEELGKSSDQIGRIIGVIDDIADQTNLLALNAAIEAARAGEQGRGFAVVADEVRKLAERTTSATKEIAQMIQTVQSETKVAVAAMEEGTKQVEAGVQTTAQAGDSLKEIIHMSEQVGEMITHIATAATQQSSATEEINNNMEQIARLVKESAEGAKQSAQACQDLSGLALDLQQMVGNFKLGEGNARHITNQHRNSGKRPAAHTIDAPKPMKALAASAR